MSFSPPSRSLLAVVIVLAAACSDMPQSPSRPPAQFTIASDCDFNNPACRPYAPSAAQESQIWMAINSMGCAYLQQYLTEQMFGGNILIYDMDDGNWGDYHPGGQTHIWFDTFANQYELEQTLAHEAAHALYGTDETQANNVMANCTSP